WLRWRCAGLVGTRFLLGRCPDHRDANRTKGMTRTGGMTPSHYGLLSRRTAALPVLLTDAASPFRRPSGATPSPVECDEIPLTRAPVRGKASHSTLAESWSG